MNLANDELKNKILEIMNFELENGSYKCCVDISYYKMSCTIDLTIYDIDIDNARLILNINGGDIYIPLNDEFVLEYGETKWAKVYKFENDNAYLVLSFIKQ